MEMKFTSFEKRIKDLQRRMKEWIEFHSRIEKKLDFIRVNKWLREHPTAEVKCDIYDLYSERFNVHVSNVPLDEFIENVLGPYHRKFDINWKMELEGDEKDPVFVFYDVNEYSWGEENFRIKEGDFKRCKIVRNFSHIEKREDLPVYNLEMICE